MKRSTTESSKRAIVSRLIPILAEEEERFKNWNEAIRPKLNKARQKTIERRRIKNIQAIKIVIHFLDRKRQFEEDEPSFIVRRTFKE